MKKLLSFILVFLLFIGIGPANTVEAKTKSTLTFITNAEYDSIGNYSEGLVWVKKGDNYKYLDKSGKVVIDLSGKKYLGKNEYIKEVGDFRDGFALITVQLMEEDPSYDPNAGGFYIDKRGNIALTKEKVNNKLGNKDNKISGFYSPFSENVTVTDRRPLGELICMVTPDGSAKWYKGTEEIYGYGIYTENLLCVCTYKDGKEQWGFVDKNFNKVIPFKYSQVRPFNQNLALVEINKKWGFINTSGKIVIKAQFESYKISNEYSFRAFSDGLAIVKKEGKWGAINKKGETVIAFQYDNAFSFNNGYACVIDNNGKCTIVNKKGKAITKTKYDDANYVSSDGVTLVSIDGVYFLINTKGEKISKKTWKFDETGTSYETPDIIKYRIGDKWGIAIIN